MKINSLGETISMVEEEYLKINKNLIKKIDELIEQEYCYNFDKNKIYIINELKDFMPILEGTEKQVKWASDIIEKDIASIVINLSSAIKEYEDKSKLSNYFKQFYSILLNNAFKQKNSKEIIENRHLKICNDSPYCIAEYFENRDLSNDYLM